MATRTKPNWKVLETLLPLLEKEGWSHAQIAEDWGISLATLEAHLTQEVLMSATSKHDYPALFEEYDQRLAGGESPKAIRATFESRGVNWGTYQNRRTQANKAKADASPAQERTMPHGVVEVLPGQMRIEDANTPAVHYGAISEFDRLPDGYAETIQPMRPYSEAEEWALNKSMELYGFIGAIVRDQYGRILDGNQRQRVAQLRGLGVPHTITHVRDDAHAIEIARALNAVRRHYTVEQRQELAPILREQGFTYREIAVALGVSKDTVQRDIFGAFQVIPAPGPDTEIVSYETIPSDHGEIVSYETILTTDPSTPAKRPERPQRVQRKGGGTYPAQRPTTIGKGQAETTRERMGERGQPNSGWINVLSQAHRLCSSLRRLPDVDAVLESWGAAGRQKAASYLKPLYGDLQELLAALTRIDDRM